MQVTTENNYNQESTWQNQIREILEDGTSGRIDNNNYRSEMLSYLSPFWEQPNRKRFLSIN